MSTTRLPLLALLCGAAILAAACDSSSSPKPAASSSPTGTVDVVAGENPWGDVARQIGGSHVHVTSIIDDPNADPHLYESDPADASAVASARLVIENGLGYDDFVDKLLAAGSSPGRRVLSVATLSGMTGEDANPHLWYDPATVIRTARAIASALAALDPAHTADFDAGTTAFLHAYQPYVDELATIRARFAGAPVGYTERVPGYLVQAAGLTLATPASFARAVEDGDDPSPGDVAKVQDLLSHRGIRVLLYNSQVTDPATDSVRKEAIGAGIPVVGVSETIPKGEGSFQVWQLGQARAVAAALGG